MQSIPTQPQAWEQEVRAKRWMVLCASWAGVFLSRRRISVDTPRASREGIRSLGWQA